MKKIFSLGNTDVLASLYLMFKFTKGQQYKIEEFQRVVRTEKEKRRTDREIKDREEATAYIYYKWRSHKKNLEINNNLRFDLDSKRFLKNCVTNKRVIKYVDDHFEYSSYFDCYCVLRDWKKNCFKQASKHEFLKSHFKKYINLYVIILIVNKIIKID